MVTPAALGNWAQPLLLLLRPVPLLEFFRQIVAEQLMIWYRAPDPRDFN